MKTFTHSKLPLCIEVVEINGSNITFKYTTSSNVIFRQHEKTLESMGWTKVADYIKRLKNLGFKEVN
jgi:hypothetical protein